ncbi:MAG TPA: hypothetical protein VKY85_21315 [Candidatus Angelobacter sp.]|nr:hypothetical protein [Candidatus Angelobacter sp.]
MRPALIAIVGTAGLIGVFVFELYLPLVLFSLNSIALCLILAGTLVPIKSRIGSVVIGLEEGISISDESLWPCIQGRKINPNFRSVLEFHLESRGFFPLLLLGILSLSAMAFAVRVHGDLLSAYDKLDSPQFVELFLFVFLSVIPVSIAAKWFFERLLLLRAIVAIGSLDSRSGGYNFVDHNEARYGGTKKVLSIHPADNICLVFYSPANPESNKSSSGLWFHRLVLH